MCCRVLQRRVLGPWSLGPWSLLGPWSVLGPWFALGPWFDGLVCRARKDQQARPAARLAVSADDQRIFFLSAQIGTLQLKIARVRRVEHRRLEADDAAAHELFDFAVEVL